MFITVALVGIALAIYARIDDLEAREAMIARLIAGALVRADHAPPATPIPAVSVGERATHQASDTYEDVRRVTFPLRPSRGDWRG